jgi:protein SSD1
MTTERLGKKKKSEKAHIGDASTIEKIKGKKVKPGKKLTTVLDIDAATKEKLIDENKRLLLNEVIIARTKKKSTSTTTLGKPVEPIVFVREKKVKKATDKATVEKKKDEKESKKAAIQEEYCHPDDIVYNVKTSRLLYEKYLDPKVYEGKIKQGKLYKGVIRINKRNRSDAYVTSDELDADILINGQHDRNRALAGDTVVVELMDLETVWAKKKESMIQKREQRHSTAAERPPQEEGEDEKSKPKYVGKVVAISAPNKNLACSGTLSLRRHAPALLTIQQQQLQLLQQEEQDGTDVTTDSSVTAASSDTPKNVRLAWFKPVDTRNPVVAIRLKYAPADLIQNEEKYKNLLMVAKITRWPIDSRHPFGCIVRELGHIGNIVAETQAVLEDNGIVEQPFGQKALKSLPKVPWSIAQSEIDKRRDLRDIRIFTIDPATAKDLDDAVHVSKLAEDEFEVGVHIADVSHFVHQHTALDHEAFDRGTSTYLCDRVIPMLPALLCEQLCSLNPEVERLAFSVIWKMDGAGNIKDTWFGKSVIK